mmetsp:Transcript_29582/g.71194  ORF Transcript_29582/g.71194 Transcript_29582/m.71194 type:complete len:416 (+) Transcript_29582:84-1331(+)
MFSDHQPRQERHTFGKNSQVDHRKKLRQRLCFGFAIFLCAAFVIVLNPSTFDYDSSALVFWTENSTTSSIGSQGSINNGDDNHISPSLSAVEAKIPSTNYNVSSSTTTTNAQIELLRPTGRTVYSYVRGDRSGAAIQDMLMAHAYAFSKGQRYGGACQRREFPDHVIQPRKELLQVLGLESEMPFRCSPTGKLMNRFKYTQQDTGIFNTPNYLEYMHAVMMQKQQQPEQQHQPKRPKQITVHIRRGDITPCRPRTNGFPRYLPNQHYLALIERYKAKLAAASSSDSDQQQPIQVVVYSESETFEPLDEFSQKGYDLRLDGSIDQVWKAIAFESDVVILSRSSFSLVPAVLSLPRTTIVYTPFWHKPLAHWDDIGTLDPVLMNTTLTEFRRLKKTCPDKAERKKQEKERKRNIKYS